MPMPTSVSTSASWSGRRFSLLKSHESRYGSASLELASQYLEFRLGSNSVITSCSGLAHCLDSQQSNPVYGAVRGPVISSKEIR